MSFLSEIQGFHGTGEAPRELNTEKYGRPARSIYTVLDPGDLHRKIEVKDEQGKTLYWTKSSVFALKGKTDVFDASGAPVAHLEKKPVSLHEKHFVTMADGTKFTLSNELFHIVKDITRIEELGWQLRGNFIGLTFNLLDENGQPVATVGKNMVSIHDKYRIDMYQPDQEQVVVSIVIQLEKMLEARSENNS